MKTVQFDDALWQVVPKEQTEDMRLAADAILCRDGLLASMSDMWEANLAAAPSPPSAQAEAVGGDFMDDVWCLVEAIANNPEDSATSIKLYPPSMAGNVYTAKYASEWAAELVRKREALRLAPSAKAEVVPFLQPGELETAREFMQREMKELESFERDGVLNQHGHDKARSIAILLQATDASPHAGRQSVEGEREAFEAWADTIDEPIFTKDRPEWFFRVWIAARASRGGA